MPCLCMYAVTLEVLNGMFLRESVNGGPPDTLVEVSLLPSASSSSASETRDGDGAATPLRKETGVCYRSREPSWGDRMEFGPCTSTAALRIRLLERPAEVKGPSIELGVHMLEVGGLHRQYGCAWIAMKEGCLLTEASVPIPDTVCIRVVWSVGPDADFGERGATDAAALAMRNATVTTLRAATNRIVLSPTASPKKKKSTKKKSTENSDDVDNNNSGDSDDDGDDKKDSKKTEKDWKIRVERLEERVNHLDSLFRTRRDYEAEVQRIMLENAEKRAQEEKEAAYTNRGEGYASLATTPSAAVALIYDQQKADIMRTVQPAHMSVAATTSPWNMFQKQQPSTLPPSAAAHFPLKWKGLEGHGSALQSILLQPTRVSSQDTQLLDASTYRHVELPKPRLIGFIPTPLQPPVNPVLGALKPHGVQTSVSS